MSIPYVRLRARRRGDHFHVRFSATTLPQGVNPADYTFAICGDIVMREPEWAVLRDAVSSDSHFEIVSEEDA